MSVPRRSDMPYRGHDSGPIGVSIANGRVRYPPRPMRGLHFILTPFLLAPLACDSDSGDGGAGGRNGDILALTGDAAAGETVFNSNACSSESCHGADGNSGSAPALMTVVSGLSDDAAIDSVLDGKGGMPPQALEDQQMADVLAWMRANF